MTAVQNQPARVNTGPVLRATPDALDAAGPQVGDDMTVEVALSVMASARTVRLRVCDNDGLCTALVTRAQLTVVRDGPGYSDRVQLRDILGERGPDASAAVTAAQTMRRRASALAPAL
ncbi:CBS domain-containing protein [Streptomyces sp. NPDC002526]